MNLNVLYIITKLELGGAQKVCLSLAKGLQENNFNSILISGSDGKLIEQTKNLKNVILLNNLKREISIKFLFYEIKNFIQLIKQIKKLKKQYPNLIIHTHSTKAGIIGRWAAFFSGIKIRIHTIHGFAFHEHQNKLTWLIIYSLELITSLITTHFICVSSADIKIGKKLFPYFKKKHCLIRAAIDWNQFNNLKKINKKIDGKKFIFGTIACFKKQKNLFDLLKAFEAAYQKNSNIFLEIIGDGNLRPEIEEWIKMHYLENNIILHGWKDNVAQTMLNWNAFVLTSLWEGLPCAIVEARLLKLPVLSYDTGGIADVIIQNKNGILFKQGDWKGMSIAMIELSINPKLYLELSNFNDALNDFNDSIMIKNHLDLYNRLKSK